MKKKILKNTLVERMILEMKPSDTGITKTDINKKYANMKKKYSTQF